MVDYSYKQYEYDAIERQKKAREAEKAKRARNNRK